MNLALVRSFPAVMMMINDNAITKVVRLYLLLVVKNYPNSPDIASYEFENVIGNVAELQLKLARS